MTFNFEMIKKLEGILKNDYLDEELFQELIQMKEVESFLKHEEELTRDTTTESLKEYLQNTIDGMERKKCYGFDAIRNNIDDLEKKLAAIEDDKVEIQNRILEKIDKYSPKERLMDIKVNFYCGSGDYGYARESGENYINIGKLLDKMEHFENIMAHESYHARIRNGEIKEYDFSRDKYLETLMFHILEEGFATVVQFGVPKEYEGFAFISKEEFNNMDLYFERLDRCIRESELEENYSEQVVMDYFGTSIPNYIVGYRIGEILFKEGGKELLNLWNVEQDAVGCFRKYINILREKNEKTGFSPEVEDYLLSLDGDM